MEDNAETVQAALMAAFAEATGHTEAPSGVSAHRWRYALVERALGEPCLWDEEQRLAVCGDWCLGSHVEAAFLSGSAAAGRINAISRGLMEDAEPPQRLVTQLSLLDG